MLFFHQKILSKYVGVQQRIYIKDKGRKVKATEETHFNMNATLH